MDVPAPGAVCAAGPVPGATCVADPMSGAVWVAAPLLGAVSGAVCGAAPVSGPAWAAEPVSGAVWAAGPMLAAVWGAELVSALLALVHVSSAARASVTGPSSLLAHPEVASAPRPQRTITEAVPLKESMSQFSPVRTG